jgi:hypothetical protein
MRKYFLLPVLFILMCSVLQAQKVAVVVNYVTSNGPADNSTIFYDGKTKLVWDDFQGKPDNSVDFAALTSSGSGFNMSFQSANNVQTMTIDVYCDYSKPESWVKQDKRSDYLLNHEQHHFDLTYIYTQHFIKKLREADFTMKNYQKLIGNIYEDVEKELNAEQTKYDDETHHSIIKDKQEEWNKKIEDELAALKDNN